MDRENVIDLTNNLEDLNTDMQNWQAMTFAMRKRADDACIRKYGVTNTELYKMIRGLLIDKNDGNKETPITEADYPEEDAAYRIAQINKSREVQASTGEVIIDDWIGDKPLPSYGEYLTAKYNAYIALPQDLKDNSDQSSLSIWGYTVPNMYSIMVNKLNSWKDLNPEEDVIHPDTLQNYVDDIRQSITNEDSLELLLRKLDTSTFSEGTVYEEVIMENICCGLDKAEENMCDYDKDIPSITPWFTPDEMKELGFDVDPYQYILKPDQEDQVNLFNSIKDAMNNGNEEEILKLGWNPSVPYTAESAKYARDRQVKWFNENKKIEVVDLSHFNVLTEDTEEIVPKSPIIKLEPIYIVLISHEGLGSKAIKAATHSKYSHAGLAFDEKLDKIYSFSASNDEGKSGFSVESIDFYLQAKNPKIKVITLFVSPEVKEKMELIVQAYAKNKGKTYYDWYDLFRILLKKSKDTSYSLGMVCSQFVDTVLKACNIDITGKPSNLVTPKDFDMLTKTSSGAMARVFVLYDGMVKNYKPKDVQRKMITLLSRTKNLEDLMTKPLKEALNMIFKNQDMSGLYLNTDNEKANKILSEVRELLTPQCAIMSVDEYTRENNKDNILDSGYYD